MPSPRRLTVLPSWLASQVALQGDRLVSATLAEAGVRKHHFAVLTALAEEGAASQAELGARVWLDRSDLHGVLNDLERERLVARVRDERDRRRNLVQLTPAGVRTLARWDERVAAAQDALLAPLSEAERGELVALLARVVEHHRAH
jgi:DNA-binding MarR family transcriptional regulator